MINHKTKIIAEIAASHNGDLELAKSMVRAAAEAGVDCVKFQSWQAKNVKDSDPDKKRYEKYELSDAVHEVLIDICRQYNVEFMTSIFNVERIPFLKKLGLKTIKVPSTYCKSESMLKACRDNFETIIISTGMTNEAEILNAAKILKGSNFAFLHCVSLYPTPLDKINLNKMLWLKNLSPQWGLSDHTHGADAANAAIAMGVDYIEKHFTLSRYLPQIPHKTSDSKIAKMITTHEIADEPYIFEKICKWRDAVYLMYGDGNKELSEEEIKVREKYTERLGK